MKFRKSIILLLCISLIAGCFTGCAGNSASSNNISDASDSQAESNAGDTSEMFSSRDKEIGYDENDCITITLDDDNTQASDNNVKISGSTITITDEGTYLLKGSLTNGQIVVDAEKADKLQLVLDGVSIDNASSAAIYVKQADKVFITLASGSLNTLSTSGEFIAIDDNNIDAVIYSKDDLALNGEGSLSISTENGNGITSKDDLILTGGSYKINASGHGLEGKDSVRIANGSFEIVSGKDGIHSENSDDASLGFIYIADGSYNITAGTDGIDGAASVQIDAGSFTVTSGGGSVDASTDNKGTMPPDMGNLGQQGAQSSTTDTISGATANAGTDNKSKTPPDMGNSGQQDAESGTSDTPSTKAIKSDGNITINGGTFNINSLDDSIHSNSDVIINGGEFELSTGDDGIHANSNVTINSGNINISKSYEGIEGQSIDIIGGTITLIASDDGLNAAGGNDSSAMGARMGQDAFAADENAYIKISGGIIHINASGDGVDSNGDISVTGGETYVSGPTNNGNGALDYNGTADISGGIFIAAGASGMAQNFGSSSTQGTILVNIENMQSGVISLKDSSGKELISYTPEKEYNSVVISIPDIKQGETYTLTMGSESQSIEMTSLIYGTSGGMGMGGARPDSNGGMRGDRPQPPTKQ